MKEAPDQSPVSPDTEPRTVAPVRDPGTGLKVAALGLFCFVLSFLGGWAALSAGLAGGSNSISDKRSVVSQEGEVVADVVQKVSPSVVSVLTESQGSLGLRSYTQQSAGTGIIISQDGYVLTNRHVVDGASTIEVVLADGTSYDAVELVGSDPSNDIAFLKINGVNNLKPAIIGDSSAMDVGEKVIAIGNALGRYDTSVTSGIISGIGRPIVAGGDASGGVEQLSNLLQTDAAINPGNSGGPLVNLDGQVVGINTAVDQEAEGIGFAIPINDARGLIDSVKETGRVEKAFLGVSYVMLTRDVAKRYDLSVKNGAYITNEEGDAVTPGSPAARAGLKAGDVITKLGGKTLGARYPLQSAIASHSPGDTVNVTFIRDGKERTVEIVLATYPSSSPFEQ